MRGAQQQRLRRAVGSPWLVRRGLAAVYRMAMAALVTQDEDTGVDHVRAMKMALVHDITEAIVGDITPQQPITEEEKHARERRAAEQISDVLGGFASGSTVLELWREYEAAETPCARLIKGESRS